MCTYHEPVCVKYNTAMRCELNSVTVVDRDDNGREYQAWGADKWKCPICGHEIVVGFSREAAQLGTQAYDYLIQRGKEHTRLVPCHYIW